MYSQAASLPSTLEAGPLQPGGMLCAGYGRVSDLAGDGALPAAAGPAPAPGGRLGALLGGVLLGRLGLAAAG